MFAATMLNLFMLGNKNLQRILKLVNKFKIKSAEVQNINLFCLF